MSKINGKKVSKKNQLHHVLDWNPDNLVFGDVSQESVPNTPIKYCRINLLTKNQEQDKNGNPKLDDAGNSIASHTVGDVILEFDKMFSFGVGESTSMETGAVTGHSMSFAMWSRDGATEREIQTTKVIETIIQKCKEHLITVRKELKNPKLEMSDLKSMDKLLYWKLDEETRERVEGQGPTFSPKLIEQKARKDEKTGKDIPYKMCTVFYHEDEVDSHGNPLELDPLDFSSNDKTKTYCYARPAVKFESIFFGSKAICIQCKITESYVQPVQMGPQRLLHRNKTIKPSYESNLLPSSQPKEEKKEKELENINELVDDVQKEESAEQTETPVEPEIKKTKVVKKKKETTE
jgi:hypothetical protein